MDLPALSILPLTPDRWPDLERIFLAKGCSIARGCWCMAYRVSGKQIVPEGMTAAQENKRALQALATADPPPGLIGYRDGQPVGWISLGPREDYAKLARSPVMKPVDDQPVWSIICFVVPAVHRGQGVAKALLHGAIAYARERGVQALEAYPMDKTGKVDPQWLWFGSKAMFDQAGFTEIARRKPERPIVRLSLAG